MKSLLILCLLGLSACSLMQRSPGSGYENADLAGGSGNTSADFYQERRNMRVDEAEQELGVTGAALTDQQRQAVALRVRLKDAEARIPNRREKKQYYDLKGNLGNDQTRLYFLSLPNFEAREHWATAHGFTTDKSLSNPQTAAAIQNKDLILGMTEKAVTQSWGDPDNVEVAGDPMYGNQRWTYSRYVSGNDGYEKQSRIVYFESGRVVGWQQH